MPDCEHCGEGRVVTADPTPVGTFRLCVRCSHSVCRLCGRETDALEYHHVSYLFDTGLDVCSTCHNEIHHNSQYEHLQPTITRAHAKEIGVNATLLD